MDSWFLILLVISVSPAWVDSQLDNNGFINIDCGLAPNNSFYSSDIYSIFVSDDQFIDTGENHKINSKYAIPNLLKELLTVRSFPNGSRNCYTIRSLTVGSKYLVRARFMYGDYDNLNSLPSFDIHLGINYWYTVAITSPDIAFLAEIIATATSDYLQVCLVNKNLGTPFISDLHLSELNSTMYKVVNSTQSLVLYTDRKNMGASEELRYPNDRYDRIWRPSTDMPNGWINISTNSSIAIDVDFETPNIVMSAAVTTLNKTQSLTFSWTSDNTSTDFFVILHFSEIGVLKATDVREIDILAEGFPVLNESYVPKKLKSGWVSYIDRTLYQYNISIQATSNSTLPPLLNAYELYAIRSATGIPTNNGDVTAINSIKDYYKVNKGWSGGPCVPMEYTWTGITCTSDSTDIPRITKLDLSSSGLTGAIISSFGNLSYLKSLDIFNNDLTGDLPAFLDKLSSLTYLDITGNKNLSSTLPPGLQNKKEDGSLIFRSGENDNKKSHVVIIVVVVGVVVLLLIAATIIIVVCLRRRKFSKASGAKTSQGNNSDNNHPSVTNRNEAGGILDFENRRFSYNELVRITNNFQNHIGTGGFGSVYVGVDNGTQVAVKMRSHSSAQGVKQFLAEAQNLVRVHHKNLVSLIGYCMDQDCMALVYEYMQEGTLHHKLIDNARPLSWKQRVGIAYESALGLEYLHKACNPPLIHRDVKTSNILLNENLEAKIADFGLSREFNSSANTPVSTTVVGTPGYLDPEYYSSYQLSAKSDVFSFGVVLLEIITGKTPIISDPQGCHLKDWVNRKLSKGDIESIVDPNMQGQYDINSVWKVTDLARNCTDNSAANRPTMGMVVTELKESLDLEISTEGARGNSRMNNPNNYLRNENFANDASPNSAVEMGYMGDMSGSGPEAR